MSNEDDGAVWHVELRPQGWRYEAPPGETLLLAAQDSGLKLPSSCRNGTCRACIARLLEGRIEYRIDWPGLSREEKDEGWILPCVACARTDLVLEAPGAINLFEPPAAPVPTALIAPLPPGRPAPATASPSPADDAKS